MIFFITIFIPSLSSAFISVSRISFSPSSTLRYSSASFTVPAGTDFSNTLPLRSREIFLFESFISFSAASTADARETASLFESFMPAVRNDSEAALSLTANLSLLDSTSTPLRIESVVPFSASSVRTILSLSPRTMPDFSIIVSVSEFIVLTLVVLSPSVTFTVFVIDVTETAAVRHTALITATAIAFFNPARFLFLLSIIFISFRLSVIKNL